jgi:hypothetical protein
MNQLKQSAKKTNMFLAIARPYFRRTKHEPYLLVLGDYNSNGKQKLM